MVHINAGICITNTSRLLVWRSRQGHMSSRWFCWSHSSLPQDQLGLRVTLSSSAWWPRGSQFNFVFKILLCYSDPTVFSCVSCGNLNLHSFLLLATRLSSSFSFLCLLTISLIHSPQIHSSLSCHLVSVFLLSPRHWQRSSLSATK